jgi:hypothetical protein
MSAMSNYLEGEIIKHIFRTGSFTKPTTLGIALVTTAVVDSDTGSTIAEVTNANAYARQTLNPLDANWSAPSGGNGATDNVTAITFPQATGNWGTVVGVAILDSATHGAGNVLLYGTLAVSKSINSGDTFSFAIGDLDITFA